MAQLHLLNFRSSRAENSSAFHVTHLDSFGLMVALMQKSVILVRKLTNPNAVHTMVLTVSTRRTGQFHSIKWLLEYFMMEKVNILLAS